MQIQIHTVVDIRGLDVWGLVFLDVRVFLDVLFFWVFGVFGRSGFLDVRGFWTFGVFGRLGFLDVRGFWDVRGFGRSGFLDVRG